MYSEKAQNILKIYMNFIDLLSSGFSQTMILPQTRWFLNFHKLFNQSKFSFVGFFYKTSQITKQARLTILACYESLQSFSVTHFLQLR